MVLQELIKLYDRLKVSEQVPKLFHSALPIGVDVVISQKGEIISAISTAKTMSGADPQDVNCQVTAKSDDRRNDWYNHPHGIVEQLRFFINPDVVSGPKSFRNTDFVEKGLSNLLQRLPQHQEDDKVSQYLWKMRFSREAKEIIGGSKSAKLQSSTLIDEFNRIIRGPSLHDVPCFMELSLSQESRALICLHSRMPLNEENLVRLNRQILEDAYPVEIMQGLYKQARNSYKRQFSDFLTNSDCEDLKILNRTLNLLSEGSQMDEDSPHALIVNAAAQKIRIGKETYARNWEHLSACDSDNKYRDKAGRLYVRWRLVGNVAYINQMPQVQTSWITMQRSKSEVKVREEFKSTKRISTLSGEYVLPAKTIDHLTVPRKGGKLVSFNESSEYNTYSSTGFADHEIYITGVDESQKYGQAMRWLAANCQVRVGDILYIIWREDTDTKPWSLFKEQLGGDQPYDCGYGDEVVTAGECTRLVRAKLGMYANFEDLHNVHLMGMRLAKGRLSLIAFHRFTLEEFAAANASFINDTAMGVAFRDKKPGLNLAVNRAPTIHAIVKAANPKSGADKKNKIPVWWDAMPGVTLFGRPLPLSLVNVILFKALTEQNDNTVWLAAAAYRNYLLRTKKEDLKMSLDKDCTDRSYRAGRIIAVHYWIQTDRGRGNPNNKASSLMQSVMNRPQLIGRIELASMPYLKRMTAGEKKYFDNLLGEIYDPFTSEGLGTLAFEPGRVIVGYHHQLTILKTKGIKSVAGANPQNEIITEATAGQADNKE